MIRRRGNLLIVFKELRATATPLDETADRSRCPTIVREPLHERRSATPAPPTGRSARAGDQVQPPPSDVVRAANLVAVGRNRLGRARAAARLRNPDLCGRQSGR